MRKFGKSLILIFAGLCLLFLGQTAAFAQYVPADGFKVSWTLDPRDDTVNFPRGPAFGARSVLVGMDFDGDGRREILFTTDETLAPGGPDPGFLDVYLYEAAGNDSFVHVWHYTMPEGTNSLPALTYGDIDNDGLQEIYFGVPTLNPDPNKLFIFEQGIDGTFPDAPTLTYDYERAAAVDFRPAGFVLTDVDGDGDIELTTVSRTGSNRELVVISLATAGLDEFAAFNIEFEAGNDILGGGSMYDVDVVDFDGDGKMEIWANTWDRWTMTIFEADSADTYSLQVELDALVAAGDPGSFNSHDMLFQDIDGDGMTEGWFPMTDGKLYFIDDTDDVSTLVAGDVVKVGTFDPTVRSRGGHVGDIDNDGRPDIVASHGTSEKVSRIEYQEIGSPADSSSYEWTILLDSEGGSTDRYYPMRVAPVDLDGDGNKEVVITNLYASDPGQHMIVIVEYDPVTAPSLAEDWNLTNSVAHTDVSELYASDFSGNSRSVIGGFDLDQDGKKEAILNDYASHSVHVFEYDMNQDVFELVWSAPIDTMLNEGGSNPRTVNVSDFDGDNKWEIVFPLASQPQGWYIFEWDGVVGSDNYGDTYSSIATTEIDTCCASDPLAFNADHERSTVFDIDNDGKQELISSIRRNSSGGLRGTLISSVDGDIEHNAGGNGFETWTVEFFVDRGGYGGGSPYHSLPADLDGDGTYEIVNATWNFFNFYNIDVLGADTYAVADPASPTRNFQATAPLDHVALFGGGAGDVDGDGDQEAFFTNFHSGNLWVVDYLSGDDVLSIDGGNVVEIAQNTGSFHTSVFDVDKNGMPNIFVGSSYPKTVTSTELVGTDPRNPDDYWTRVIYTGEPDIRRDIVVTDSAGVMTTTSSNTGVFASKVQAEWNGNGIDFDMDGNWELLLSYQSNQDSVTTTTLTWNTAMAKYDTVITKIKNDKSWGMSRIEFSGTATGVIAQDVNFITPEDYTIEQNYPNPFNPTTTIEYVLPIDKKVSVRIYNMLGQVVRTLIDNQLQATGRHTVIWDSRNDAGMQVASGRYIYSLEFGNFRRTKQMTLLK